MRRAQQDPTRRRRTAALGLGIAALLTVAACGSGQIAQTSGMPPAVDGGLGQAGPIAVRDAVIAFPESGRTYGVGSNVPLVVTIVNSGSTPDRLVSVTSTVSAPATLSGSLDIPAGAALVAGGDLLDRPSQGATAQGTTTTEAPASSSSAPTTTTGSSSATSGSSSAATTTTTTEATATTTTTTSAAPTTSAQPVVGQASIVLKQVNTTIQSGQSIMITFTFAHAGAVTIAVPVAPPGGSSAE